MICDHTLVLKSKIEMIFPCASTIAVLATKKSLKKFRCIYISLKEALMASLDVLMHFLKGLGYLA